VAGDSVTVAGTVSEFFPDQSDTPSALPVAEIDSPVVTVVSTGNPLPAPVIIGSQGVLPPAQNIFTARHRKSTDVTTVTSFAPLQREPHPAPPTPSRAARRPVRAARDGPSCAVPACRFLLLSAERGQRQ